MAKLKVPTVRFLRDLARKHLGKGHSKLKTKDELLAALKKFVPGLHPEEGVAATPSAPAEVIRFEKPAEITMEPSRRSPAVEPQRPPSQPEPRPEPSPEPPSHPAEPVVEGFFVARVFGEHEARDHHLVESAAHEVQQTRSALYHSEQLPEIPFVYEDDRVALLARDPQGAFLFWDFHPRTRFAAFDGLPEARVVLRVFENGHEVRTLDAALESRGFYLHGLSPNRDYAVEVHAVGSNGESRRIGPRSNSVRLPADDVSADRTVRFMRVPWDVPLTRLRKHPEREVRIPESPPEPLTITHSRWVPAANSGSWQLQMWTEQLPRGQAGREAAEQGPNAFEMPPFEIGGSSSWTLAGSGSWVMASSSWSGAPSSKRGS